MSQVLVLYRTDGQCFKYGVCVNAMSPFYDLNPSPLFAVAIGHQFHGNRCPSSNHTFSSNLMSISVTRSSNNLIVGAFHTSDMSSVTVKENILIEMEK